MYKRVFYERRKVLVRWRQEGTIGYMPPFLCDGTEGATNEAGGVKSRHKMPPRERERRRPPPPARVYTVYRPPVCLFRSVHRPSSLQWGQMTTGRWCIDPSRWRRVNARAESSQKKASRQKRCSNQACRSVRVGRKVERHASCSVHTGAHENIRAGERQVRPTEAQKRCAKRHETQEEKV